ncbi:MAG: hypothetical protein KAI50_10190 [Desulfobacterales bacterium]|nr:hypothetical protein [Desulfobacterales bacterium]
MPRCGNKAEFEYEVSFELLDTLANVTVERKGRDTLTAACTVELKETKTILKWPDQEKENGEYYGGCKVDWKGLDKENFKSKFNHQKFQVRIATGEKSKNSGKRVDIKPYADKGPQKKKVGFPIDVRVATQNPALFDAKGDLISKVYPKGESWIQYNVGRFWIQFKDGEFIITVKVQLNSADSSKPITSAVWNHFKKKVETFWNDPGHGFRQWVFHRTGCVRKEFCDCTVLYRGKKQKGDEMIRGGCCKFPVRVVVEEGGDNPVNISFLTQVEIENYAVHGQQVPGYSFNSMEMSYPEDQANSYAHEVGHMMGLPDEYPPEVGGTVDAQQKTFPITKDSIMGTSMQKAYERHLSQKDLFVDFANSITGVKIIKKKKD